MKPPGHTADPIWVGSPAPVFCRGGP